MEDNTENRSTSINLVLEEYKEACTLHRLHVNLLYGELVAFLAISGGLLLIITDFDPKDLWSTIVAFSGCFIGILITNTFTTRFDRLYDYSFQAREYAKILESRLDFNLYKTLGETNYEKSRSNIIVTQKGPSGRAMNRLLKIANGVWVSAILMIIIYYTIQYVCYKELVSCSAAI